MSKRVASVNIKQSKTEPFPQEVTVRLGVIAHKPCLVRALARYLAVRGLQPEPLFIFRNGMFLTRAPVLHILTHSLPDVPFVINTHYFRRGGASALGSAGTSGDLIKLLGRLKYCIILHISSHLLVAVVPPQVPSRGKRRHKVLHFVIFI